MRVCVLLTSAVSTLNRSRHRNAFTATIKTPAPFCSKLMVAWPPKCSACAVAPAKSAQLSGLGNPACISCQIFALSCRKIGAVSTGEQPACWQKTVCPTKHACCIFAFGRSHSFPHLTKRHWIGGVAENDFDIDKFPWRTATDLLRL